jgi:hypothetical protein
MFAPLPIGCPEAISNFRQLVARGERELADYECGHNGGIRERTAIYCFRHALDIANGCLQAALAGLPDSTTTLTRAMLEALIWSRYVTLSDKNAQDFADGMKHELLRIVKKNVVAGNARIVHDKSGDDMTGEVLDKLSKNRVSGRLSIEKAAEASGLDRVYATVYGFMSIVAHGKGYDLRAEADSGPEIYSDICLAIGALECIEIITHDWLTHARLASEETLTQILGVLVSGGSAA